MYHVYNIFLEQYIYIYSNMFSICIFHYPKLFFGFVYSQPIGSDHVNLPVTGIDVLAYA